MKPVLTTLVGALLVISGVIHLLAEKSASAMDKALNVTCFIGICIGVVGITMGLNAENNK